MNRSIEARGENYFQNLSFPIAVKKIEPKQRLSHQFDLTFKRHHHNFSELVIVTKGEGVQFIKDTEYNVKAGDVFLLKGEDEHYFVEQNNIALTNIMFDESNLILPKHLFDSMPSYKAFFELEPTFRKKHNFKSHLKLTHEKLLQILALANEMSNELLARNIGYESSVFGYFVQLITFVCREYAKIDTVNGKSLMRVSEVIAALESDLSRKWTLADLSKIAHMSENNLLLLFKEATKDSPIAYVNRLRLKTGAMLLKTTHKSITEIAFECGFNDGNYFTRLFHKEMQISPRAYRKRSGNS